MRARAFLTAAALLALAGVLHAAYLENDYQGEKRAPETGILPPPRPVPDNPLAQMVRRAAVRDGYSWGGLTVYLVEVDRVTNPQVYLSTQEALAAGVLRLYEKPDAEVPALIVENRGEQPVLMLGGEMLLGGRQNRTPAQDVLVPARSGPIVVPVLCIEQGRWRGAAGSFDKSLSLAPLAARHSAVAGGSQEEVWSTVSRYQESLGVSSETRDLAAVGQAPEVRKRLDEYRGGFERCWRPQAVGMVVARWGEIVGADLFANAGLFLKHRDRLLDSYATDCITWPHRERMPEPRQLEAERFLRGVLNAPTFWMPTPGLGRTLNVRGPDVRGSALVLGDDVLHAALFPAREIIVPRPLPPEPMPLPQPMPRE
jgi:hypothetical protein